MFGQQNKPAFGTSTGSTFGGFGTTNTTTPFGQTSAFGSKPAGTAFPAFGNTSTPLFGGTSTAPTGGGLFSGGTTAFGNTPTAGGFGTSTANTGFSGFGTTNTGGGLFGTPAQQTTNVFGAQAAPAASTPATGGLFGSTNTSLFGAQAKPAFGSSFGTGTTGGGLFGQPAAGAAPAQTPSLFGQPASTGTTGGLFGSTAQAATPGQTTSLFGQPASGGLFGSTGFGSTTTGFGAGATGVVGTTIKFKPLTGTDTMVKNGIQTSISTQHQCITCMKEYETKSLEELRLEDYAANRKGGAAAGATPAFGQQPKSLFGATPAPGLGATTGLFGQPAQQQTGAGTSLFGKPVGFAQPTTAASSFNFGSTSATPAAGTSLFGQPAQQTTPFGAPTSQPSLFGTPQTTQAGFGSQPSTGFSFGTPAQQPATGGLFGASKPAFGTATAGTGFGFGQTAATSTGLFGAKPGGTTGFGTPAFGATSTATAAPTFGFGTSQAPAQASQSTGLFGSSTFGKPTAPAFSFGTTTTPSTGFGFGQTGTTSLFGGTAAAAKPMFGTGTSTFGTPGFGTGATTGFGTGLGTSATPFTLGTGTTSFGGAQAAPAAGIQTPQISVHQHIMALAQTGSFTDHPLFRSLGGVTGKREEVLKSSSLAPPTSAAQNVSRYVVSPRHPVRLRPKAITGSSGKGSLFEGLEEESSSTGDIFVPRKSVKKLSLKPGVSSVTAVLAAGSDENRPPESPAPEATVEASPLPTPPSYVPGFKPRPSADDTVALFKKVTTKRISAVGPQKDWEDEQHSVVSSEADGDTTGIGERDESIFEHGEPEEGPPHPVGIVLRRSGYYTEPSLAELANQGLDENGKCIVPRFTIGREGYGSVFFDGPMDVANLNLDQIVFFRHKELVIYPDDNNKPPVGEGLNRKAVITLERVWPVDKTTTSYIRDPQRLQALRYQERLERASVKLGARFVEYKPESGSWVFKVNHFSKYGLEESDEEGDLPPMEMTKLNNKENLPLKTLPPAQQVPNLEQSKLFVKEVGLGGMILPPFQPEDDWMDEVENLPTRDNDYHGNFALSPPSMGMVLARATGTSTAKLQAMKASFFGDSAPMVDLETNSLFTKKKPKMEEEPKRESKLSQSQLSTQDMSFTTAAMKPRVKAPVTEEEVSITTVAVALPDPLVNYPKVNVEGPGVEKPRRVVPKFAHAVVPTEKSILKDTSRVWADHACFKNRGCRVGWGPGLTLVTLNAQVRQSVQIGMLDISNWVEDENQIEEEEREEVDPFEAKNPYVALLRAQWNCAQVLDTEYGPQFVPALGNDVIVEMRQIAHNLTRNENGASLNPALRHLKRVWDLCHALWGPLPDEESTELTPHTEAMARREALSIWLEADAVDEWPSLGPKDGVLGSALSFLTGRRVKQACSVLQGAGNLRLALLLSQAGSAPPPRVWLQRQMATWEESGADEFVDVPRKKTMSLLAGWPIWTDSKGQALNVCEGLQWPQAFAFYLWYICSPIATIPDALSEYEKAMKSNNVPLPLPEYLRGSFENNKADLCYALLQLYCTRATPMEPLLDPSSQTWDPLDHALSWLLYQTVSAIGYNHLGAKAEAILNLAFAAQLEQMGLWPWAIFVLLHLKDGARRREMVQAVLGRHISMQGNSPAEDFIKEALRCPPEWLETARAVKAQWAGKAWIEAKAVLAAKNYNRAHRLIIQRIAPDAILAEKYDELYELLAPLADYSSQVEDWNQVGVVYWEYVGLVRSVDSLFKEYQQEDSQLLAKSQALSKLTPEVLSLSAKVAYLPTPTPKHRLCRAEIAQRAAQIMRAILELQVKLGSDIGASTPSRLLLPQLQKLPLPEDYALQELQALTRAYLLELNL